jgi:hypothetical protein
MKKLQTPSNINGQSVNLYLDVTHSDAMSDATATTNLGRPTGNKKAKEEDQDKKWKYDMIKVQRSLVKQSTTKSEILSNQKNAMAEIANEAIMSIDLSFISKSCCPYYKWKQKKILENIEKKKDDEKRKEKEEEEKKKKEQEEKKKNDDDEKKKKEWDSKH